MCAMGLASRLKHVRTRKRDVVDWPTLTSIFESGRNAEGQDTASINDTYNHDVASVSDTRMSYREDVGCLSKISWTPVKVKQPHPNQC